MRFRLKLILINVVDAVLLNGALLAALALRFDGQIPSRFLDAFRVAAPFYTMGLLLLLNLAGVNRSLWRYAGVPTVLVLIRTLSIGHVIAFAANLVPQARLFPMSVVILTWILATGMILASRLAWKMVRNPAARGVRPSGKRVLIVGAGDVGAMLAREMQRGEHRLGQPIGFVDDDPQKRGRRIETLEVLGTTFDIPRIFQEKRVGMILIAAPSAPSRLVRQVVEICQEAGVECQTMPALSDFIAGKGALGQVRDVQIEDLLGRDPVKIDLEGISELVAGKTVLVTGAGGSIGSELCRQLARFRPGRLVALDHCENRLTYLGLDLAESHPDLNLTQVVGDIRDEQGIDGLMSDCRPQVVYHAAAHKHVHFLESAPREAVINNILGTRNLILAADRYEVERFLFISTDKAVNPSNVMGASKRACEILLQSLAPAAKHTTYAAVRFGNVLGSDGSVLPIFRRQMAKGGPLTVTHPDVRRYFMTIPEASQLVLQASLFGTSGDVFVLDMGEQIRILDVAEQLIRLSGLRPGLDMQIRFVGLRPGEKLEEELLTDSERTRVTEHHKIFRLELDPVSSAEVEVQVAELSRLARESGPDEIRRALAGLVPEYVVREVAPLPAAAAPASAPEKRRRRIPVQVRPRPWKRAFDLAVAGLFSLALFPLVGMILGLYRMAGPGPVRFVREDKVGRNRRKLDRRRGESRVPIDRRYSDRRSRPLPGPPFVSYQIELPRTGRSRMQGVLAGWMRRYRLDRILYLWNVLRGEMSLVGPAARLLRESSVSQDWLETVVFAARPGLIGPAALLAGPNRSGSNRRDLYDGFYARFGGPRLDLQTLMRAAARILKGEDPWPAGSEAGQDFDHETDSPAGVESGHKEVLR